MGYLVPLFMLTVFEIAGRKRPVEEGYLKMESLLGDENRMEDAVAKKAGRAYSGMALKILAGTYLAVGLISLVLSFFFPATRRLLLLFGGALTAISLLAFLVLRIVNARRSEP